MFTGVKYQQSKRCPSCMRYSYLTRYISHPKIKLSLTVCELWSAQDFGITDQGRNVHNRESESILEHGMPTGPYLCCYQIL